MTKFKELAVWKKAHDLTLKVYWSTAPFPKDELYGLTSQIRRASSSIPANIAEGCGRGSRTEFGRFLHIALASANELEYHLLLARDLALLEPSRHAILQEDVLEVQRMLAAFIRGLKPQTQGLRPKA